MFYSFILWYTAFMQRPQGLEMCTMNLKRKVRKCLLDQLLWHVEQNITVSYSLPKKRKIACMRVEVLHYFQNQSRYKKQKPCFTTFHTVFWEGFAKELTAEPQWAKFLKRWSLSGQVPPLVPMAKVKLNLLSTPLKLVSQDSELCLPSITSAGTKRETPQRNEDQSNTHSHSNHQGPTIPLWLSPFHKITNVIQMKRKMPPTSNYSFFQKRGKMSKVKMLITTFQWGQQNSFHDPIWGNIFTAQHQLSISTLFMNMPPIVLRPPPRQTVQSINQSNWITWHSCTKVDFNVLQMNLKNKYVSQKHSMSPFVMSQNELLCVRLQWQARA